MPARVSKKMTIWPQRGASSRLRSQNHFGTNIDCFRSLGLWFLGALPNWAFRVDETGDFCGRRRFAWARGIVLPTRSSQWTTPGGQGQQGQHSQHSQDRQDRINTGRTVPSQVDSTGLKSMHFIENNCFCSCLLKCVARPVHRRAPKNSVSRRRNSTLRKSSENVLARTLICPDQGLVPARVSNKNIEFGRRVAPVHV